jgi:predicted nuclease with TOPRIM domain
MLEGHEDRLQRMESTMQGVGERIAGMEVGQRQLAEGQRVLADSVDDMKGLLSTKLDELSGFMSNSKTDIDKRFLPLEDADKHRVARWGVVKKLVWPVVIAAVGVLGGRFGEELLNWVAGK